VATIKRKGPYVIFSLSKGPETCVRSLSVVLKVYVSLLAAMLVQGNVRMLQTVLKYMPLKATMREVEIPGLSSGDITFYGVVSSQEFQSIIVNAKVCSS